MKFKKWMSIVAAVCLAVTAVPMQVAAQEEFAQEEMLEEIKEEPQEELKEEPVEEVLEEIKEEPQEELKEEPVEESEEEPQEQPAEEIEEEPQEEELSLLTGEENGIAVLENADTDFEGECTEANPYKINSAEDLKTLAQKVNSGTTYEGKYFKQTADIDLENKEWTPIGNINNSSNGDPKPFEGFFDGDGYQITNLTITNGREVGLFGYAKNATIRNCNVAGEVSGYNNVGGIVGAVGGKTNILNCSFQGNVTGNMYVGGIVGQVQSQCEVSSCYVIGTVHGGNDKVGGIAGEGRGAIKNCYALADVSARGKFAGGITGDTYNLAIENCYYSGEVSASKYAGGIVGNAWGGTIKNCVSLAESVTGSNANRIVGNLYASAENNYAWSGTEINNKNDGIDLIYNSTNGTLSPQFSEIFGSGNSAWKFAQDGLPILKNVGGAQLSELPKCMTGVGFDGFGIKTSPYLIQNAKDLKTLAQKVNGGEKYEGKYFKQTANIDLENETNWTPIGTDGKPFKGIFDGDGYKITNLKISNGGERVGLFGYVDGAIIQNCNVTGEVKGNRYVGGIVGNAGGKTQILNCSFKGDATGKADYVGGIAGKTSNECEVNRCYIAGTVCAEKANYAGGIAGWGAGAIRNCYVLADVNVTEDTRGFGSYAGGITGYSSSATIENCYYNGEVSADRNHAGGIVGYAAGSTTIKNCVSLAESVKGDDYINRIVGCTERDITLTNNYSYNRTKLVIGDNTTYADGTNEKDGANVFVSKGKVTADIASSADFWAANGFDTAIWSIPTEAGKLPFLRDGVYGENEYPKLPVLPSKDLTIDETPQHFTTRNIGNGFVVTVLSEETLSENIKFVVKYRLSGTSEWTDAVPNTAGTYDVQITRAADGDINPFACEISEGLVLAKKRSSSSSTTTPTYTVQFDTNGGSAVSKVKTDENGKIEKPADPSKEGYVFAGWYSDSKLTKRFDFSTELTANSTLYAKWSENNEIILTIGSKTVSVFGSEIENDVAPKIVNDRTMLPIRIVAENLGGTVTWNGELQRVTMQKGADVILITIGADTAYVNGAAVQLDAAAFVENGRTYLPLRFVSENLGAQVTWNETEKTVTIIKTEK